MQKQSDTQTSEHLDRQEPNQVKKDYKVPTLTDYGTVEQFTQNGMSGLNDGSMCS